MSYFRDPSQYDTNVHWTWSLPLRHWIFRKFFTDFKNLGFHVCAGNFLFIYLFLILFVTSWWVWVRYSVYSSCLLLAFLSGNNRHQGMGSFELLKFVSGLTLYIQIFDCWSMFFMVIWYMDLSCSISIFPMFKVVNTFILWIVILFFLVQDGS